MKPDVPKATKPWIFHYSRMVHPIVWHSMKHKCYPYTYTD